MEEPIKAVDIKIGKVLDYIFDNPTPIVYFVRCNEYVKIGSSNGKFMPTRLGELQVGNPYKLEFETFMLGNQKLEKSLHRKLKKFRHRGEWFKLNKIEVKILISNYYKNVE